MVKNSDDADILIVNTCGFLESARQESVDVILEAGELKKSNQVDKLVVMGCFSDRYAPELKKEIPEVDAFFGTDDHALGDRVIARGDHTGTSLSFHLDHATSAGCRTTQPGVVTQGWHDDAVCVQGFEYTLPPCGLHGPVIDFDVAASSHGRHQKRRRMLSAVRNGASSSMGVAPALA